MRVAIFAVGTRGDAEPALALAFALTQHGHEAVVGVAEDLVAFGRSLGVDTRRLSVNARDFLDSEDGRRWLEHGDTQQYIAGLMKKRHEVADAIQSDMIDIVAGADMIVSARLVEGEAWSLAEWLGVPFVGLQYAPMRTNRAFPSPMVSTHLMSEPETLLTHEMFQQSEWRALSSDVSRLRKRLGLPTMSASVAESAERAKALEIQAYSRFVLPELSQWDALHPLVGYLRLAPAQLSMLPAEEPDATLADWLDQGEAPVYFGFGSMPLRDPAGTVRMIRAACATLGVRALVSTRSNDLPSDDHLCMVGSIDHEEVLPRCQVAVHHGGAGTTAASLRAGAPTVICSVFSDQPFWGATVERLGVGQTLPFVDLSEERLVAAIRPLLTDEAQQRSKKLADALRTEDGPEHAAKLIGGYVA
jgi:sterol 3beta-glucosyltransferase